ncbi:MAG: DUF1080 domain-containing protein [Chitinophagaceae bacterium]|nr:DUF1080 domain-containing protein [Chitinophagaceae bacterium]
MTSHLIGYIGAILFSACFISSCTGEGMRDNQLTEKEKKEGWVLLFDGNSTKGWHLYNNAKDSSTWTVKNGELTCGPDIRYIHLDLVSDKEYKNFDLRFDWKINKGGNSGVFINVVERPDIQAAWASGPEYQILEKSHPDYEKPDKRPGGLYGFAEQGDPVDTRPFNEWNESRIRQQDGRVEFYLNGVLTAQRDFHSQGWVDSVGKTYFNNFSEFGRHTSGHIALQDWQKAISFKNIRIRELP